MRPTQPRCNRLCVCLFVCGINYVRVVHARAQREQIVWNVFFTRLSVSSVVVVLICGPMRGDRAALELTARRTCARYEAETA